MQAGLLPYYFLQQLGLNPAHELAVCSFYDERQASADWDERDVVERVGRREYDAGAVSRRTIEPLQAEGTVAPDGLRIIWSSPGYSHCASTRRAGWMSAAAIAAGSPAPIVASALSRSSVFATWVR